MPDKNRAKAVMTGPAWTKHVAYENGGDRIPDWAKPSIYVPIEIGCLARVLPYTGEEWSDEIVMVICKEESYVDHYRVMGSMGVIVLPAYTLQTVKN